MKSFFGLVLVSAGTAAVCLAGSGSGSGSDRWAVREQETIQKTLTLSGEPMRLVVDNVDGYVHVKGSTNGTQVRITAHKTIRAETDSDLAQAKSEVSLEMTEKPGTVSVYYDAPWRCNGQGRGCRENGRRFYEVTYDIDVEVPRAARSVVSAVNGKVQVAQMDGDFEVSDVNGGIGMSDVSGSGEVRGVNGPIAVHFARNPLGATSFKTINGSVDVYLRPELSADLLFKTFNGEIYSDFEVNPRAMPAAESEQRDGKFIYRSKGPKGGRVGHGGAELSFDSFNGSIRLHREQ